MKVGLIGHGMWGANLARNFHSLGALAAVSDASRDRRKVVEETYPGVDVFENVESLLDRVESLLGSPACCCCWGVIEFIID